MDSRRILAAGWSWEIWTHFFLPKPKGAGSGTRNGPINEPSGGLVAGVAPTKRPEGSWIGPFLDTEPLLQSAPRILAKIGGITRISPREHRTRFQPLFDPFNNRGCIGAYFGPIHYSSGGVS